MSASKKENLFAKLAQQNARAEAPPPADEAPVAASAPEAAALEPTPSPALVDAAPVRTKPLPSKRKAEPVTGKRTNPDYCQANAYVPKSLRREIDRALLDIDHLDYSTLVEDLLRKWLKSRGISA